LQGINTCKGGYETHYYAGEAYSSSQPTIYASGIRTTVVTPSGAAESEYGYFQILSVFDSGGHYDQLGFANNCGTWVQLYSFTSNTPVSGYSCDSAGGIYYCGKTGIGTFSEGTAYTYEITVPSSGSVDFEIFQWSGDSSTVIWSHTVSLSGANSLVLANAYSGGTCPSGCTDYTDYEELYFYTGARNYPSYNIFYKANLYELGSTWHGTPGDWSSFTSGAPSAVIVQNSYDDVSIINTATYTAADTALLPTQGLNSSTIDLGQSDKITFRINDYQGIAAAEQDLEILFPSFTSGQTASCFGSSGLAVSYYPSGSTGREGDYGYLNFVAPYGYADAAATSVASGSSFIVSCTVIPTSAGNLTYILESPMEFSVGGPYGGGVGWLHWPAPVSGSDYVTDFKGEYGIPFTVTVDSALVAGAITPSALAIDEGQSVTLTANPSGGTSSYSYQWYAGAGCTGPISGATSSTYAASPTSITTYYYKVTDSVPASACSSGDTVAVNSPLSPASILVDGAASSTSVDSMQTVTLSIPTPPSGGTSPYTCGWLLSVVGGGTGRGSSDCSSSIPLALPANTYYMELRTTDSSSAGVEAVYSNVIRITVNPPLSAEVATPHAPSIDRGQSINLTAEWFGGTWPHSEQWYTGANCTDPIPGASSPRYVASPTSTTTYYYNVTDSSSAGHESACSPGDTVTVNPTLTAGEITPLNPAVDLGHVIVLIAKPSGGTGSYGYQWYAGAGCTSPINNTTGSDISTTPVTNTTFYYEVNDTGVTSYAWPPAVACSIGDIVTVNPPLTAPAISVSASVIDAGQSVTLSTTVSFYGGTPPYTCNWAEQTPAGGYIYSSYFSCNAGDTPSTSTGALSATGNWSFELQVNDNSWWPTSITATSNSTTVVVDPQLKAPTVSVSPVTVVSGQSATLTTITSFSGGTSPYTCQWLEEAPGAVSYNNLGSSFTSGCTTSSEPSIPSGALSATGMWYFELNVTDSSGMPATVTSNAATITVSGALAAGPITPSVPSIDAGQSVTLNSQPSGGATPYSVTWYTAAGAGACSTSDISVSTGLTFSPSPTTSTYYCYIVTDSESPPVSVASSTDLVTVNPALTPPKISVSPTTIGKGQSAKLSVKTPFKGGTSPYTCQWLKKSPTATSFTALGGSFMAGCTTSSKPSRSTGALTMLGTWTFELQVKDAAGAKVVSSPVKLTVKSLTHVTITCTKSTIAKGAKMTCTATVTGKYSSHTGTITWTKASGKGSVAFSSKTCELVKGKCSVTVKGTTKGSVTIKATYNGDTHNLGSSGTLVRTIT
jgi:hypothetical protein